MTQRRAAALMVILVALAACSTEPSLADVVGATSEQPPPLDPASVAAGRALYAEQCAECHGAALEGADDWKTPLPTGGYPPPPHDPSGHTWHHPDSLLLAITADPESFGLQGMPKFGGSLSTEQMIAIFDYIKSTWGPEERAFQWARSLENP